MTTAAKFIRSATASIVFTFCAAAAPPVWSQVQPMIIEKTMISGDLLQFMLGRRGAMTIINKSTNSIKNISIQAMSWADVNNNGIPDIETGEITFSTVATIPLIGGGARMTVYLVEGAYQIRCDGRLCANAQPVFRAKTTTFYIQ